MGKQLQLLPDMFSTDGLDFFGFGQSPWQLRLSVPILLQSYYYCLMAKYQVSTEPAKLRRILISAKICEKSAQEFNNKKFRLSESYVEM